MNFKELIKESITEDASLDDSLNVLNVGTKDIVSKITTNYIKKFGKIDDKFIKDLKDAMAKGRKPAEKLIKKYFK